MSSKISKRTVRKEKYKKEEARHKSFLLPLNKVIKYIVVLAIIIWSGYNIITSALGITNQKPFKNDAKAETVVETKTSESKDSAKTDNSTISTSDLASLTYNDTEIVYVNDNKPLFLQSELQAALSDPDSVTKYTIDNLNRPTGATLVVTKNTVTSEDRGDISNIYPPGWDQEKYNTSLIDGGYIYNRCHLIAHCLGGIDDKKNLITGTRYLNIDGMWQIEETVKNTIKDHQDEKILYRITPVYVDEESVCRGVLMEAYSLNDNGQTLKLCVYCYNVQPYININYHTGKTSLVTK